MRDVAEHLAEYEILLNEAGGFVGASVGSALRLLVSTYRGLVATRPFRVGDRVQLLEEIDFAQMPGWSGGRHFLVVRALATVSWCTFDDRGWRIYVQFDDDSYLRDGVAVSVPAADRGNYGFPERALRRVT